MRGVRVCDSVGRCRSVTSEDCVGSGVGVTRESLEDRDNGVIGTCCEESVKSGGCDESGVMLGVACGESVKNGGCDD